MANKKRYIKNESDLLKAMRSTGFCFPTNDREQKMSLKLSSIDDSLIQESALEINPIEIWDADNPIEYDEVITLKPEVDYTQEWGIAAKGKVKISKSALDKILKNQNKKKD
mgnify:CR=1 FL=1